MQYMQSFMYGMALKNITNKGNAKRDISPRLKIRPCDLDL